MVKKEKSENLTMVNQGPSTKEVRREGGCSLHFLGEERGIFGVEITGLVAKLQIIGKIRGEILGKILGGVITVTTQEGVIGGLVPPRMRHVIPVPKLGTSQINVGEIKINDLPHLSLEPLAGQVNV